MGALFLVQEALKTLADKGVEITEEDRLATQIAILLHDVGHGPFSHALESVFIPALRHEQMSRMMIGAIDEELGGRLQGALTVFDNRGPKRFLSQLISGQLDMDRMDYLMRDSYFTGVVEGMVGGMRIIKTLNVHDNRLVVELKGINSVEKFIVARRLMYWQVYLHKTALACECMLIRILKRAKYLIQTGRAIPCRPNLRYFLERDLTAEDAASAETLDYFISLDDTDILFALKEWQASSDFVLRELCQRLLQRKLLKLRFSRAPISVEEMDQKQKAVMKRYRLSIDEMNYLVFSGRVTNMAYLAEGEPILILHKDGSVTDIIEASDSRYFGASGETITKYYLCYPEELSN